MSTELQSSSPGPLGGSEAIYIQMHMKFATGHWHVHGTDVAVVNGQLPKQA